LLTKFALATGGVYDSMFFYSLIYCLRICITDVVYSLRSISLILCSIIESILSYPPSSYKYLLAISRAFSNVFIASLNLHKYSYSTAML